MRLSVCVVISICALAGGCHPRPPNGVRKLGDRFASIGKQLAPLLSNVDLKLVAKVRPPAPALAQVEPSPAQVEPSQSRPEPSQAAAAAAPATAPAPDIKIDRIDASRPTVFVLRGQTHGGQAICETHTTSEACNTRCTSLLRPNMFQKPEPSMPKSCSCMEQDGGC